MGIDIAKYVYIMYEPIQYRFYALNGDGFISVVIKCDFCIRDSFKELQAGGNCRKKFNWAECKKYYKTVFCFIFIKIFPILHRIVLKIWSP